MATLPRFAPRSVVVARAEPKQKVYSANPLDRMAQKWMEGNHLIFNSSPTVTIDFLLFPILWSNKRLLQPRPPLSPHASHLLLPRAVPRSRRAALAAGLLIGADVLVLTAMPSGAAFLTDPDADESAPSSSPPVALAATATGLKYADLVVGEGETPVAGAIIKCNYTGTFADGRVFDSSLSFGRRPLGFPVGKGVVIKGWDLAILGNDEIPPMKKGGKRRIEVPPQLGYGSRGAGGTIPPNTTLFFDIELLP
jgi:hypothetical protein